MRRAKFKPFEPSEVLTSWGRRSPWLFWPCCKQRLWRARSPVWLGPAPWSAPWLRELARTGPSPSQGGACRQGRDPQCKSWRRPPSGLCSATEPVRQVTGWRVTTFSEWLESLTVFDQGIKKRAFLTLVHAHWWLDICTDSDSDEKHLRKVAFQFQSCFYCDVLYIRCFLFLSITDLNLALKSACLH